MKNHYAIERFHKVRMLLAGSTSSRLVEGTNRKTNFLSRKLSSCGVHSGTVTLSSDRLQSISRSGTHRRGINIYLAQKSQNMGGVKVAFVPLFSL